MKIKLMAQFAKPTADLSAVRLTNYLSLAFVGVAIAVVYVRHEDPAYLWDWGAYWRQYQHYGDAFTTNIGQFLKHIAASVATDDYNPSALVPMMPLYWLFGGDRATYIAGLCALYVVPTAFVAAQLARDPNDETPATRAPVLLAAFLYPVFWNAALRGMVDAAGLIPLGLAAAAIWDTRFLTRASWKTAALLGLSLWLTFLLRRWYAFSLIALISLSVVAAVAVLLRRRPLTSTEALRTFALYCLAGASFAASLLLLQLPLVLRVLATSYSDVYSAYQRPMWDQIVIYYNEFGAFTLAPAALGLIVDIRRRRYRSLFFLMVASLTGYGFSRNRRPVCSTSYRSPSCYFPRMAQAWRLSTRSRDTCARWRSRSWR